MTEEDYADDGCVDDWEAIADAFAADDIKINHNTNLKSKTEPELHPSETIKQDYCYGKVKNHRAWRPDDARRRRSQGLPNSDRCHSAWGFKTGGFAPSPCPICCEDLDLTDLSFFPCSCGYRLCLFCHKKILEDNGRCPGCRKQYEHAEQGITTSKIVRSHSMIPRR